MTLLVFAHSMEATVFINKLKLKKENISLNNVYSGSEFILLVTGQGISNVISKLTNIITIYGKSILQIKNFGIAGRLDSRLKINKCYEISSVIMNDRKYMLGEAANGISCVTSNEAISNEAVAEKLLQTAQAVDMELWAVADVAASFKIPAGAVKLLSDDARQTIPLNEVIKNVKFYSDKLFDYFSRNI